MTSRRTVVVMAAIAAVAATSLLAPHIASAQFWDKLTNPKFNVPITHPPRVVLKGVTRIAIQEIAGDCGPELTDRLSEAISRSGKFEVLDRAGLEQLFAEKGLQSSGAVSAVSTTKLGELLGAAALLTGRVTRCKATVGDPLRAPDTKDYSGRVHTNYVRKTTATLLASLRIVDVTTGKTYTPSQIDGTIVEQTQARDGIPEAADENQVLSRAYEKTVAQFLQNILPWTETVSLTVFDDDKYSLKLSSNQMKSGQFDAAGDTVKKAIEAAGGDNQPDKKLLAKAYYNLGIALMYAGNTAEALPALQKSQVLRQTDIANEAINTCQRIMQLDRIAESREQNAIELGKPSGGAAASGPGRAPAVAQASQEIVTNADIIAMVKAKMSDAVVLSAIKSSRCQFDTTPKGLIALKTAGVSDVVIQAMTEVKK